MRLADLPDDPMVAFAAWREEAMAANPDDAVCLATASADGRPSARIVLLRGFDDRGFRFFTNRTSDKARDLAENPLAALVFHWPEGRQVRVEGSVETVDDRESDEYWAARPRGSQLGAWASDQSAVIDRRETLETALREATARFDGHDVPRPPHWGGYRVVPNRIEFWMHRDDRLHDRVRFRRRSQGQWVKERLAP